MPGVKVIADAERVARYSAQPVICNGKECHFDYVTPEQGQPVDLVLVAVKATVLEQAIKDIKKFVGPDTIIISVLNGITSENDIEAVYPGHCLWSVAIGMDATRVGRSLTFGAEGRIQFGEKGGEMTDRVKAVDEYLTACGIASEPCNDILFKQWSKLMVNDGLNQAAAAFDLPYGGLTKPGPAYDKMLEAMQEVIDLSVLEGVNLPADNHRAFLESMAPTFKPDGMPSMRQDVLAKRPTVHSIYFARHGETVWNVENKICGMTDSPLTEKGRQQARELGRKVKESGVHIDEILYSPLSRAADTAKAVAEATGLPARCEPRLREQCFGKYEGTPRDGAEFRISKTHFADRYDGGESMMQLAQRIYNLLDELRQDENKTYLLVAHNGIARVVESYFHDMTNEEYSAAGIKNCELVEYRFE